MEFVGVIRCPLRCLVPYGEGRQIDDRIVDRLVRRYRKATCDSSDQNHHIQGIITYGDLNSILASLRLTREALYDTIKQDEYPLLPSHNIAYFRGRHRIAAATILDPDAAWAVQLHCVKADWVSFPATLAFESPQRESHIQDEVEFSSCESAYSDGEIYRLIRKYTALGDTARVDEVRSRLTPCKEISLNGFLKRHDLVTTLDALLEFPGMLGGLQLGNIHKHLALHADELIKRNFEHIHRSWSTITNHDPQIKKCANFVTIRSLQLRAPMASASDRTAIKRLFEDRVVFSQITDIQIRRELEQRILGLDIVIPSIETFHENMKLISIGVHILRDLVLEKKARGKGKASLSQSLSLDWRIPKKPILEIEEGVYRRMPNTDFQICYVQLLVATIRHFPRLSSISPRQDSRGESISAFIDNHQVYRLFMLASALGFENAKIKDGLSRRSDGSRSTFFTPGKGRPAQWRCGRPFTKSYLALKANGFLANVLEPPVRADVPSPIFIFRDMLQAFFCDLTSFYGLGFTTNESHLDQRINHTTGHQPLEVVDTPMETHDPVTEQHEHDDEPTGGQLSVIEEVEEQNTDMPDVPPRDPNQPSPSKPHSKPLARPRKERRWAIAPRRGESLDRSAISFTGASSDLNSIFVFNSKSPLAIRPGQGVSKATMPSLNERRTVLWRNAVSTAIDTPATQIPGEDPDQSLPLRLDSEPPPASARAETTPRRASTQVPPNAGSTAIDSPATQIPGEDPNQSLPSGLGSEPPPTSAREGPMQRRASTSVPPIRGMKRQREEQESEAQPSVQIRRFSELRPVKMLRLDLSLQNANTWNRRSGARSPLQGRPVPGDHRYPIFFRQDGQRVLPIPAGVPRSLEGAHPPQNPEEQL